MNRVLELYLNYCLFRTCSKDVFIYDGFIVSENDMI